MNDACMSGLACMYGAKICAWKAYHPFYHVKGRCAYLANITASRRFECHDLGPATFAAFASVFMNLNFFART